MANFSGIYKSSKVGRASWLERLRAFFSFLLFKEIELTASSIAYNAMLGFFPGILLLKLIQDLIGYRVVYFKHLNELSAIAPQPVIQLLENFLTHVSIPDNDTITWASVLFVVLLFKSVAGSFSGFLKVVDQLTDRESSILRRKWLTGVAAVCVLIFAALLFIITNLEMITNPSWAISQKIGATLHLRLLLSMLVLIIGIAMFFKILAGHSLSIRALWIGAVFTAFLWLGGCFIFFSYRFDIVEEQFLYGAIASSIATLLWFYVTAYMIIIGLVFSYYVVDGKVP